MPNERKGRKEIVEATRTSDTSVYVLGNNEAFPESVQIRYTYYPQLHCACSLTPCGSLCIELESKTGNCNNIQSNVDDDDDDDERYLLCVCVCVYLSSSHKIDRILWYDESITSKTKCIWYECQITANETRSGKKSRETNKSRNSRKQLHYKTTPIAPNWMLASLFFFALPCSIVFVCGEHNFARSVCSFVQPPRARDNLTVI